MKSLRLRIIVCSIFIYSLLIVKGQPTTTLFVSYTGSVQTFTVPQTCVSSITIQCFGSSGGTHPINGSFPGAGSSVSGVLTVTPGSVYYITVGSYNGYNGGGFSGGPYNSGGGATDIRFGGTGLADRIMVAGGGGGSGVGGSSPTQLFYAYPGGSGGGVNGQNGQNSPNANAGSGATGTLGGMAGVGGCSTFVVTSGYFGTVGFGGAGGLAYGTFAMGGHGGGGGGGYIGGGGGGAGATTSLCNNSDGGGGGGGAAGTSYISPAFSNTTFVQNANGPYNPSSGYVIIRYQASPSMTVNASSTLACNGNPITLTANSSLNTYTWSTGSTNSSISVSPTSNTFYTVTSALSSNPGCSATKTVYISAGSSPSLVINLNPGPVCAGGTVSLLASGANSYTWSGGISNGNPFVPAAGSVYTVNGQNICGTSISTVAVNVLPKPTILVSSTNNTLCAGLNTTLSVTGASSYTWSNPASNLSTVVVSPASNTCYSVIGSVGACADTANYCLGVLPLPPVAVSGSSSLCLGSGISLIATGANSYTWSTLQNSGSIAITPTANGCYTVTGQGLNGCTNTATHCVNVVPGPALGISGPVSLCAGSSVTLSANSVSALSYTWLAIGSFPGSNNASIIVSPVSTTNYTVVGANISGCVSQSVVPVTVIATLPATITSSPGNTICAGETLILTAYNAQNCIWFNSVNSNTFSTPSIFVNPAASTMYSVMAVDANGCHVSGSIHVVVITCALLSEHAENISDISVFPNPTEGRIVIQSGSGVVLHMFNQFGQEIGSVRLSTENNFTAVLDNLENGVYFLSGKNATISFTRKIIVTK